MVIYLGLKGRGKKHTLKSLEKHLTNFQMKYAIGEVSFAHYLCKTTHLNRKPQDFKTTRRRTRSDATDRHAMKGGKNHLLGDLTFG